MSMIEKMVIADSLLLRKIEPLSSGISLGLTEEGISVFKNSLALIGLANSGGITKRSRTRFQRVNNMIGGLSFSG